MSKISENNLLQPGIPGTISVMSRQNTVHNPSLVQDIWEFDHDPDDQFIKKIIRDKQAKLRKQHSHQQLQKRMPMYPNDGSGVNQQKYRYHSQVTMQMELEKNEYGLAQNKQNGMYVSNKDPHGSKKSLSRSRSNCSQNQTGRQIQRMSKSIESKDSLQHIRNIEQIARSLPGFEDSNSVPHFFGEDNQDTQSRDSLLPTHEMFSPTRNLDIYSHKYISNLNYMLTQIKQLLSWNKMHRYQAEIQDSRKAIMKLQIDCRKLKIGLRSSVSVGGLFKLRRKQYIGGICENEDTQNIKSNSKDREGKNQMQREYHHVNNVKKKSLLKPTWGSRPSKTSKHRTSKIQSQRERILCEQISSQRKKYQQLGTRESLITNYYNVLKNKLLSQVATDNTLNQDPIQISLANIPHSILPSQSKIITPKALKHDISSSQNMIPSMKASKNYQQIQVLLKKKQILKASINESKDHYQKKIKQLSEEIVIMKREFQIIEGRIYGCKVTKNHSREGSQGSHRMYYQQSKPQELYYNNNMINNPKKIGQFRRNHKNSSSSHKKLTFRSSSSKEQINTIPHRFGQNHNNSRPKNPNWKINKVKSNKELYNQERGLQNEEKKTSILGRKQKPKQSLYFNQHSQYFANRKSIEGNFPK